ncbi:MAG: glycosyltransferase [Candidatus Electrothrix sp. AR1]|nr:glycosyltransferase [Candidatus Electrothrix sp. AR1]
MRRKKILFLDQTLNGGGAERVLCTVMRGLDPEKYEIHLIIITKIGELAHLIPDYVHIHILGIPHTRKALLPALRSFWKIRPDIVYTTTVRTALLISCLRLLSPKFIFIMRFPIIPEWLVTQGISDFEINLIRFFLPRIEHIIAQSHEMAEQLVSVFGVSKRNINTIDNPIDYDHLEKCIAGVKNPFNRNKINIIASGRIDPQKGFDILLTAFAEVVGKDNKYNLFILGRDQAGNTKKLQALTSELSVQDHVHFLGFQENPYPYYKFCDLFVLSSRAEGCPNVLLEAIYFERPVVATKCVPIISKIIKDGENGFLVEPDNAGQLRDAILAYQKLTPQKKSKRSNGIVQFIDHLC